MPAFTARSSGYKRGVVLLVFASLMFFAGFTAPYWASQTYADPTDSTEFTAHEGPWMPCIKARSHRFSTSLCLSYGFGLDPTGWFHAVRALEAICLVFLFIACIYAVLTNYPRAFPGPRTRVLEILSGSGGVLGVIGVIVYATVRNDEPTSTIDLSQMNVSLGGHNWTMDWALYLAGFGSGLAVVAALIIGLTNKEISQPTTGTDTTFNVTTQQIKPPAYVGGPPGYTEYPA